MKLHPQRQENETCKLLNLGNSTRAARSWSYNMWNKQAQLSKKLMNISADALASSPVYRTNKHVGVFTIVVTSDILWFQMSVEEQMLNLSCCHRGGSIIRSVQYCGSLHSRTGLRNRCHLSLSWKLQTSKALNAAAPRSPHVSELLCLVLEGRQSL